LALLIPEWFALLRLHPLPDQWPTHWQSAQFYRRSR
jgi:hypothetical protein